MIVRFDARLSYTTHIPRDVAVNTFHFNVATTSSPTMEAIGTAIKAFYNTAQGDADLAIAAFISSVVSRGADDCDLACYVVGTEGPPVYTDTWTLGDPDDDVYNLPLEVAACLSYRGSTPGTVGRRQRGRIYLGPLNSAAITYNTDEMPTLSAPVITAMIEAGAFLALNPDLEDESAQWAVYSRVGAFAHNITSGFVDNEFDTQRRRQQDATVRIPWVPASPP